MSELEGMHVLSHARPRERAAVEMPPPPTHRRYQPPFIAQIAQAAAGFSVVAAPSAGLHYLKVLAAFITLDAAGTLQFLQGPGKSTTLDVVFVGGPLSLATNGGFVLPPADPENPWFFCSPEQTLSINTATGKANGWVLLCQAPYDQ